LKSSWANAPSEAKKAKKEAEEKAKKEAEEKAKKEGQAATVMASWMGKTYEIGGKRQRSRLCRW
jgi:hypothetical protein